MWRGRPGINEQGMAVVAPEGTHETNRRRALAITRWCATSLSLLKHCCGLYVSAPVCVHGGRDQKVRRGKASGVGTDVTFLSLPVAIVVPPPILHCAMLHNNPQLPSLPSSPPLKSSLSPHSTSSTSSSPHNDPYHAPLHRSIHKYHPKLRTPSPFPLCIHYIIFRKKHDLHLPLGSCTQ